MDEFINAKEASLSWFDACPSELFVSVDTDIITHIGVHYFTIYKTGLEKIPQFKNSRGLDNKLKWIDYLIENIIKLVNDDLNTKTTYHSYDI